MQATFDSILSCIRECYNMLQGWSTRFENPVTTKLNAHVNYSECHYANCIRR